MASTIQVATVNELIEGVFGTIQNLKLYPGQVGWLWGAY